MTTVSYPAGPLDSTQEFIVYAYTRFGPAFLTHSGNNGVLLRAVSTRPGEISPFLSDDNVVILRASGTYDAMKFYSTTGSTTGEILVGSLNNGTMTLVFEADGSRRTELDHIQLQSVFQVPPEGEVLLSSAPYTLIANDDFITGAWNQVSLSYIDFNGSISNVSLPVQFIPVNIYYNNGQCSQLTTNPRVDAAILSTICQTTLGRNYTQCDKFPTTPLWTTLQQCDGNIPYQYCGKSEYCGTCYGVCQNGLNCVYSLKNKVMTCSGSIPFTPINPIDPTVPLSPVTPVIPNKPTPWTPIETTPFYKQTWFILLVAAVIFLVLVIIIIYEYESYTSTPKYTEPYIVS